MTAVDSLKVQLKSYLKETPALGYFASIDEAREFVSLLVVVADDAWSSRVRVLDRLAELHEMFIDDLTLSYTLSGPEAEPDEGTDAVRSPAGEYATVR